MYIYNNIYYLKGDDKLKDIKNYLEKQLEISNKLNNILVSLETMENKEKELLYQENERLLNELNNINNKNMTVINNRISAIKKRTDNLLLKEDVIKNTDFKNYLIELNNELQSLLVNINEDNKNL